jgi:hypothetical protein
MPRKCRRTRLSSYDIPAINPEDRNAVDDHDLVRHVLVDFEELADLPDEVREQLVAELVIAIWAWRAGVKLGKRGLSDAKEAQHIYIADVRRALERAGLSATRWRKTYEGDGPDINAPESFYFRVIRALGDAFGIPIPKDLMLATERASKIQYGVMSPAMEAAQAAELVARGRQRLGDLTVRLTACATQGKGDLRLATATTLAVPEPETVYEALPLELRLLALGLSSAKNFGGSSAVAGSLFAG